MIDRLTRDVETSESHVVVFIICSQYVCVVDSDFHGRKVHRRVPPDQVRVIVSCVLRHSKEIMVPLLLLYHCRGRVWCTESRAKRLIAVVYLICFTTTLSTVSSLM